MSARAVVTVTQQRVTQHPFICSLSRRARTSPESPGSHKERSVNMGYVGIVLMLLFALTALPRHRQ